ncbi:MAG TPA: hypothetical protein VGL71_01680 [Urbifossiella sp.]
MKRMAIPCPCCKASNETGPLCRRCKADLSLLFAIDAERAESLASARGSLADLQLEDAFAALERAEPLRRGPDITRLKAAVFLLNRDFASALSAYDESHD